MPPRTPRSVVRITPTAITALRPRSIPVFLRDTSLKGFQVKMNPNGNAVYQVEARLWRSYNRGHEE